MDTKKIHIIGMALAAIALPWAGFTYAETITATLDTGTADDTFRGLATACDGGFIVAGHTQFDRNDMAIMHLSDTGDLLWQKVLTGSGNDLIREVQADCDRDSYLVAGMTSTGGFGASDIYTARIATDGTLLFQTVIGTPRADVPHAIDSTGDGGYIVAGYTTAPDKQKDYVVAKVNQNGTLDWQTALNSKGGDDVIREVRSLSNGNYLAVGFNRSLGERGDIWAVMLDSTGAVLWQNLYGGGRFEEASTILEVPGGIIVMEESGSFSASKAGWIFKIDYNGTITKQVVLETAGDEELSAAVVTENNTIIAVGETMPGGTGQKDFLLTAWDFDLNLLSQHRLGTAGTTEQAEAIVSLGNGSYVISGTAEGNNVPGGTDIQIAILRPGNATSPGDVCEEPIPTCGDPVDTHAIAFDSDAVAVPTSVSAYSPGLKVKQGSMSAVTGGFEVHVADC